MLDKNTLDSLEDTKKLTQGKSFFGKLTRLFMGKKFMDETNELINQAENHLNSSQFQEALSQTGVSATAIVLAIENTGKLINHNPMVNLTLKIKPIAGTEFTKSIQTVVSLTAIPKVNDEISVMYNPNNTDQIILG